MRYGIISDIHGNLEALEAVWSNLQEEDIQRIFFLGDIVGYGPDPNRCIEKIREIAHALIAGNHDHAVVGLTDIKYFNPYARKAIEWTITEMTEENLAYLRSLPLLLQADGMTLVHSSPKEPKEWYYIATLNEAEENLDYFSDPTCLIGHSHQPFVVVCDIHKRCFVEQGPIIQLKDEYRYIINAGSVGQPRDGDPRACYVIIDKDKKEIRFNRITYDYRITQDKMRRAGLSRFLIERLAVGK